MSSAMRNSLLLLCITLAQQLCAQQGAIAVTAVDSEGKQTTVTIVEPGRVQLARLFDLAEAVVVKVISGDTENYANAVYKAEVLRSFKGTGTGEVVYFGPYVGVRLGWEYVLFLRSIAKPLTPKDTSKLDYGTLQYFQVFNQGYSQMETSYRCGFDGKTIDEECDYGVRVCTNYVVLPKSIATFPPMVEETSAGCRWVRKEAFLSELARLRTSRK
jgi:hypothetical protein